MSGQSIRRAIASSFADSLIPVRGRKRGLLRRIVGLGSNSHPMVPYARQIQIDWSLTSRSCAVLEPRGLRRASWAPRGGTRLGSPYFPPERPDTGITSQRPGLSGEPGHIGQGVVSIAQLVDLSSRAYSLWPLVGTQMSGGPGGTDRRRDRDVDQSPDVERAVAGPGPVAVEPGAKDTVLLVCSSGGHLAQLMVLRSWWEPRDVQWVTFDTADAVSLLREQTVVYAHHPTTRNVRNVFRNFVQAVGLLRERRPSVIVSSGAGVAFPYFVAGWIFGTPCVYIEVVDRIETPTLTGRLCRPFASRFLVQWPSQQLMYRGSETVGVLL